MGLRFEIEAKALKTNLAIAAKAAPSIHYGCKELSCVKLESSGEDRVFMRAMDMSQSVNLVVPAKVTRGAQIMLRIAELRKVLRDAKGGDMVRFEYETHGKPNKGHMCAIMVGDAEYSLRMHDENAWFSMTLPAGGVGMLQIDASELAAVLDDTMNAMAPDWDTRYYLRAIFFGVETDDTLIAVTTNGHLLHERRTTVPIDELPQGREHNGMPGVILSAEAAKTLRAALRRVVGLVTLYVSGPSMMFDHADFDLTTSIVDAHFPNWRRLMPDLADYRRIRLDAGAILDATKGAVPEKEGVVHAKFSWGKGSVGMNVISYDSGTNERSEIPVIGDMPDNLPSEFMLCARYLAKVAQVHKKEVDMHLRGAREIVAFTHETNEDLTTVLMPLKP